MPLDDLSVDTTVFFDWLYSDSIGAEHIAVLIELNSIFCALFLWSYASHGAQCGVTTSHSTCCGCCFAEAR